MFIFHRSPGARAMAAWSPAETGARSSGSAADAILTHRKVGCGQSIDGISSFVSNRHRFGNNLRADLDHRFRLIRAPVLTGDLRARELRECNSSISKRMRRISLEPQPRGDQQAPHGIGGCRKTKQRASTLWIDDHVVACVDHVVQHVCRVCANIQP